MSSARNLGRESIIVAVAILFFVAIGVVHMGQAEASEFPGRDKFPEVPYIGSNDLFEAYSSGDAIIIDVRSTIEYNVIHPVDSLHIPVARMDFVKKVKALAAANSGKKIAFYCNGTTCLKSYVATRKAMQAGIENVVAYDGGIPEWVMLYPEKTLLLGKVVTDPEKQVIPKAEFKKKAIPFEAFKAAAADAGGLVIDVRDTIQRSKELPGLGKTLKIPLDKFIPNFVEKKRNQGKPLYVFDQVGKQVRWLEYYLVAHGYTHYKFLKGGATGVLKEQKYM